MLQATNATRFVRVTSCMLEITTPNFIHVPNQTDPLCADNQLQLASYLGNAVVSVRDIGKAGFKGRASLPR